MAGSGETKGGKQRLCLIFSLSTEFRMMSGISRYLMNDRWMDRWMKEYIFISI